MSLPFTPPAVIEAVGKPLYPSYFGVNSKGREIFTLHGLTRAGANPTSIFCVYDIDTGALKTWFFGSDREREALIYREHSGKKWIYSLGADYPIRYDITTLPAAGSQLPVEKTFTNAVKSRFELAWDGKNFTYMKGGAPKYSFIVADTDFNFVRPVNFPLGVVGVYTSVKERYYPKTQGVAWHRGQYVFGAGKYFIDGSDKPAGDPNLPGNLQGLLTCDPAGNFTEAALSDPRSFLNLMGGMLHRKLTVVENEGVSAGDDGKLYAIWQVLDKRSFATEGRTWGLVITEEMAAGKDAVDFSPGAYEFDINRMPLKG